MTDSFDDPTDDATHRGGFGEFAGEATGLIDRSFREQIVLVGVQLPGASDDQVEANLNPTTTTRARGRPQSRSSHSVKECRT